MKDEHGTAVELERVESAGHELELLARCRLLVHGRGGVLQSLGVVGERDAVARLAAVVGRRAAREREEPRPERTRRIVGAEPRVDRDEDVVHDVFQVTLLHAQAAEVVPHVLEVILEEVRKIDHQGLGDLHGVAHGSGLGPRPANRHGI